MPEGAVRSGNFSKGTPISLPLTFGTPVTTPRNFGNEVPAANGASYDSNPITWLPSPSYFGNSITGNASPFIESISPTSALSSGGTTITITGTGFLTGATVMFGSTSATGVVVVSSNQITCNSPSGTAGLPPVTVFVTNTDGQVGLLGNAFTVTGIVPIGYLLQADGVSRFLLTAGGAIQLV